jgi:N utilization substance protein A
MDEATANEIIMAARAHWFGDEAVVAEDAEAAEAAEEAAPAEDAAPEETDHV